MTYQQIYKKAHKPNLRKKAGITEVVGGVGAASGVLPSALWITAAATIAAVTGIGVGTGWTLGKVTQPGKEDMNNLYKQHTLARLKRDNQTQKIQFQREDAERRMRQNTKKPVRIFG